MTLQFDGFSPSALTGLERVGAQGWPYHGAIHIVEEKYADAPGGVARRAYAVGQPQDFVETERGYLLAYPPSDGYGCHTLRYHPAPEGWGYHFGYSWHNLAQAREYSPSGLYVTHPAAGDSFGQISKNTERWVSGIIPKLSTGVPLQGGHDGQAVCRVDLLADRHTPGRLYLRNMASGRQESRVIEMPVSPDVNVRYVWPRSPGSGAAGPPGLVFSFSELASIPPSAASSVFATRIHDIYKNRMIVSVGIDMGGYSRAGHGGVRYAQSVSAGSYDGGASGLPERMAAAHGWQPLAFYEVVLDGQEFDDVMVNELFSWEETSGDTRREIAGADAVTGDLLLESEQLNCIIDAYYAASGEVQPVRGDFSFRCESHRYEYDDKGALPDGKFLYYRKIEYSLKHSLGAQEREISFFQEIKKFSRHSYSHLEIINGGVTVDEERHRDFGDSRNTVFDRCPYPGAELRALTMPCVYYSRVNPETDELELFQTPLYTLSSLSGRHCSSLSMSTDSSVGIERGDSENVKRLSSWYVMSKTGVLDMPDQELPAGYQELVRPSMQYMCPGFMGHPYLMAPVNAATGAVALRPVYDYNVVTFFI